MSAKTKEKPSPGRPVALSDKQRRQNSLERNRLYQASPEYKERRKERYRTDAAYRQSCLDNAKMQAEKATAQIASVYAARLRSNIKAARSFGSERELDGRKSLTFSVPEMASLIERTPSVLRGWINSGRFPEPREAVSGVRVYTRTQAINLTRACIEYLRVPTAHLTSSRTEPILAMHQAMR